MKKTVIATVLTSVLFLASQAFAEASGIMMVVKGDIKITSAKGGKTDAAKVGSKVVEGDTITAGPDSRAKIVMSDRNVLNISPESKVVIAKYESTSSSKNVELKVEYGKVRASVEQKYDGEQNQFNIKTPAAVAGVRGTDFITGYSVATRQTSVITFSGMVAVGTMGPGGKIQNPVYVRPGQTTTVDQGKAPEAPKAMPKEDLNKMNQESAGNSQENNKGQQGSEQKQAQEEKKQDKKDEPKKDEPKKEAKSDQPAEKKEGAKRETAAAPEPGPVGPAQPGPEPKRDPASLGGPDLPPPPPPAPLPGPMPGGPAFNPMPIPVAPIPQPNAFIDSIIKNQKARTTIIIQPK